MAAAPDIRDNRIMMSLSDGNHIKIIQKVTPGKSTFGCLKCCHAPSACWCCSLLPCCKLPKDVLDKMEGSKYIYIRENSIEWNEPDVVYKECKCCIPFNPCQLDVIDNVEVMYYDDPSFDKINDKTRCLNDCRTAVCGGQGQRVQIINMFCAGLCIVGKNGACCCPSCCPNCCARACTQQKNLWVEDAQKAVYEIKMAKLNAKARMNIAD